MLSNFNDIKTDVLSKLGVSTTAAYYTDTILNDWIKQGTRWATSFKKWPFTEGRASTTYTGLEELSFEGYKADSFRIMTIGGKRLKKLNFEDYLIFREEEPDGTDRVFSDFGRLVIVNPNVDASGSLVAYGQYQPVDIDTTDLTSETVFTGGDEEGNEAIVEKVLSYAKTRETLENEANFHDTKAKEILDALWSKTNDEQFNYKTHRSRGGMWQRIEVVNGDLSDELVRRDRF